MRVYFLYYLFVIQSVVGITEEAHTTIAQAVFGLLWQQEETTGNVLCDVLIGCVLIRCVLIG